MIFKYFKLISVLLGPSASWKLSAIWSFDRISVAYIWQWQINISIVYIILLFGKRSTYLYLNIVFSPFLILTCQRATTRYNDVKI